MASVCSSRQKSSLCIPFDYEHSFELCFEITFHPFHSCWTEWFLSLVLSLLATHIRARATSAAPPYFKPFSPKQSDREYIDGAVYHNNPIKVADAERKYLWPDVETLEPDILLSIGTGKSSTHLAKEAERWEKHKDESRWSKLVPKVFQIVFARMNDILDSETTWKKFFVNVIQPGTSQRYIRINPELTTAPPALDEKDRLLSLEDDVKRSLGSMHEQIRGVADRLVASCFYFEKANVQSLEDQTTGIQFSLTSFHAAEHASSDGPNLLPL